ncbi:MAG: Ig-like domain-containing protein [Oxalobacteraceae bacterium]|nr:Ig-like domain-containing protein [Oxalobacteraceae bacterium]
MRLGQKNNSKNTFRNIAAGLLAAIMLTACGGGGGSPGTPFGDTGTTPTTDTITTGTSTLKLSIVDGSGVPMTTLSGGQIGTVRAIFIDGAGAVVPNAVVKFTASDSSLLQFTPVSASALTDQTTGIAVINFKPADFNSTGALTIKAEATAGIKSATGEANVAIGAAPLTVGTLSVTPTPTGNLPAFNTVSVNIPVTSNGQPVNIAPGLTVTSQCKGDAKADIVLGAVSNGVATATYTNTGCTRGTDVITAAIGSSSKTISIGVDSAYIGTIQFTGTDSADKSIVLKGSGGLGRKESAVVTFKVVDQNNNGLSGVAVAFKATTTTGGLTVLPSSGTTDALGNVTTTVSSGTIPTPVRVIAEAVRNSVTISGLSDALTISTGLPVQRSMSLSADKYNIEGLDYDNVIADVTILMADQYGNPISDNTAINFVTEGGAVGSSAQGACTTLDGGCTVTLKSQQFKPINGRVTVLAYAQGVEDFIDSNGDGQYSCTNYVDVNGNLPVTYRPLVDICVSGGEPFSDMGDPFLDAGSLAATSGFSGAGTLDGVYTPANGDKPFPYNSQVYSATGDGKWGINYIRRSAEFIFSGSSATLVRQVCDSSSCRDWAEADGNSSIIQGLAGAGCASKTLVFRLIDENNNPLPSGTTVASADADKVTPQTFYPAIIPSSTLIGGTFHQVTIKKEDSCAAGSFSVKVTTPKGKVSVFFFNSN